MTGCSVRTGCARRKRQQDGAMKTLAGDPELWSRRRWVTTVIFSVAVQAGLAFRVVGSLAGGRPAGSERFSARSSLTGDEPGAVRFLAVGDPTLLTLIHPQPFASGRPRFTAPELPQPWDLTEPPHWLSTGSRAVGRHLCQFPADQPAFPVVVDEKPAPSVWRWQRRCLRWIASRVFRWRGIWRRGNCAGRVSCRLDQCDLMVNRSFW